MKTFKEYIISEAAWNETNITELKLYADNTHIFDPEMVAEHHRRINMGHGSIMGDKDAHRQMAIHYMNAGIWEKNGYKLWRNFVDHAAFHYTREHGVLNRSRPEKIQREARNIFSHADRTKLAMMYQDEFEHQYHNGELDHLK